MNNFSRRRVLHYGLSAFTFVYLQKYFIHAPLPTRYTIRSSADMLGILGENADLFGSTLIPQLDPQQKEKNDGAQEMMCDGGYTRSTDGGFICESGDQITSTTFGNNLYSVECGEYSVEFWPQCWRDQSWPDCCVAYIVQNSEGVPLMEAPAIIGVNHLMRNFLFQQSKQSKKISQQDVCELFLPIEEVLNSPPGTAGTLAATQPVDNIYETPSGYVSTSYIPNARSRNNLGGIVQYSLATGKGNRARIIFEDEVPFSIQL